MDNIFTLHIDNDQDSPEYLTVCSCGVNTEETDGNSYMNRPHGRKDYQLCILTKGEMIVEADGNEHIMHAGDVFLYKPNKSQVYYTRPNVPYEWRWVHFSGTGVPELLDRFKITDSAPLHLPNTVKIERQHTEMVSEFIQKKLHYQSALNGQFLVLLSTISRTLWAADTPGRGTYLPKLEASRQDIYWRYNQDLEIEELAKNCNFSPSRYLYLFKRQYGVTPHHYQTLLRIEKAKTMLQSTDFTIRQISEKVGYVDHSYFSRVFKRIVGLSPSEYRQ